MAEGGDLYSQAVAVVTRDRKASTSYIQRRLQIGYNRAAIADGADGEGRHRRPAQPRRQARNPDRRKSDERYLSRAYRRESRAFATKRNGRGSRNRHSGPYSG